MEKNSNKTKQNNKQSRKKKEKNQKQQLKKTNKQTHNVGISERLVKITPTQVLFNYDST